MFRLILFRVLFLGLYQSLNNCFSYVCVFLGLYQSLNNCFSYVCVCFSSLCLHNINNPSLALFYFSGYSLRYLHDTKVDQRLQSIENVVCIHQFTSLSFCSCFSFLLLHLNMHVVVEKKIRISNILKSKTLSRVLLLKVLVSLLVSPFLEPP